MKNAITLLALSLLLAACGGDEATDMKKADKAAKDAAPSAPTTTAGAKKYNVKSGIVESKMDFIGPQTIVTYFDEYGAKEATYTTISMMGTTSRTVSIVADGYRIEYDMDAKTGRKTAGFTAMPAALPNLAELTEELKKEYKLKELGTKTFLGKEATGIEMEMMGMKMVVYHWQNIPLYSEVYMGEKPMIMEATKLETDVPIPADKFQVPADIKVTEYDAAGKEVKPQ